MQFIAKEPNIHVELLIEDQKLSRVFLKKHQTQKGFTYSWIQEKPNSELEKVILEFLNSYSKKKAPSYQKIPCKNSSENFFSKVLNSVADIPFGKTKTYGEIARLLESPRAARAVGFACHKNTFPLFIPCHRVIAANGELRGFAGGVDIKKELLLFENS